MIRAALALASGAILLTFSAGAAPLNAGMSGSGFVTPRCDEEEATAALDAFLTALARGNAGAVNAVFAPNPEFKWYSTTAPGLRSGSAAYRRETLLNYFRARVRKLERLSIFKKSLHYVIGPSQDTAGANGYLRRRATDLNSARFGFKFAVHCAQEKGEAPQIIAWSMARAS